MDMLLEEWKTWDEQIAKVDEKIAERASQVEPGKIHSPTKTPTQKNTVPDCAR